MTKRKKNLDFSVISENSMLEFQSEIIRIREECDTWAEAIASYCEDHSIDVEEILHLLSDAMKTKLYEEGVKLKRIKVDHPTLDV